MYSTSMHMHAQCTCNPPLLLCSPPLQCIWKVTRQIPQLLPVLKVDQLLKEMQDFFQGYTQLVPTPQADDKPYRTAKTILFHLTDNMGSEVLYMYMWVEGSLASRHTCTCNVRGVCLVIIWPAFCVQWLFGIMCKGNQMANGDFQVSHICQHVCSVHVHVGWCSAWLQHRRLVSENAILFICHVL